MRLVVGEDKAVGEWASAALGVRFQEPFTAFGFVRDGEMAGAAVFNDYYPGGNVELTYVGQRSFSRDGFRFMTRFAFVELKCSRMTAKTRRSNQSVKKMLERFGFKFEAYQRRYFGPNKRDDALVYVLLPDAAKRWMK